MKQYNTYCDHCGKLLNNNIDNEDADIGVLWDWFEADLCQECAEELVQYCRDFCKKDKKRG